MNPFKHSRLASLCGAVYLLVGHQAFAVSIQSIGAGSAVTTVNLSANFDGIANMWQYLGDYSEGGLSVTTPQWAYTAFDPFNGHGDGSAFFYPEGGAYAWVAIQTTDSSLMTGVEFLYGNGGGDYLTFRWKTMKGSTIESVGSVFDLARGTVIGISDSAGVSELLITAFYGEGPPGDNAIAIDNLRVQTGGGYPSVPVPDGGFTAAMLGAALLGLAALRRKLGIG